MMTMRKYLIGIVEAVGKLMTEARDAYEAEEKRKEQVRIRK